MMHDAQLFHAHEQRGADILLAAARTNGGVTPTPLSSAVTAAALRSSPAAGSPALSPISYFTRAVTAVVVVSSFDSSTQFDLMVAYESRQNGPPRALGRATVSESETRSGCITSGFFDNKCNLYPSANCFAYG